MMSVHANRFMRLFHAMTERVLPGYLALVLVEAVIIWPASESAAQPLPVVATRSSAAPTATLQKSVDEKRWGVLAQLESTYWAANNDGLWIRLDKSGDLMLISSKGRAGRREMVVKPMDGKRFGLEVRYLDTGDKATGTLTMKSRGFVMDAGGETFDCLLRTNILKCKRDAVTPDGGWEAEDTFDYGSDEYAQTTADRFSGNPPPDAIYPLRPISSIDRNVGNFVNNKYLFSEPYSKAWAYILLDGIGGTEPRLRHGYLSRDRSFSWFREYRPQSAGGAAKAEMRADEFYRNFEVPDGMRPSPPVRILRGGRILIDYGQGYVRMFALSADRATMFIRDGRGDANKWEFKPTQNAIAYSITKPKSPRDWGVLSRLTENTIWQIDPQHLEAYEWIGNDKIERRVYRAPSANRPFRLESKCFITRSAIGQFLCSAPATSKAPASQLALTQVDNRSVTLADLGLSYILPPVSRVCFPPRCEPLVREPAEGTRAVWPKPASWDVLLARERAEQDRLSRIALLAEAERERRIAARIRRDNAIYRQEAAIRQQQTAAALEASKVYVTIMPDGSLFTTTGADVARQNAYLQYKATEGMRSSRSSSGSSGSSGSVSSSASNSSASAQRDRESAESEARRLERRRETDNARANEARAFAASLDGMRPLQPQQTAPVPKPKVQSPPVRPASTARTSTGGGSSTGGLIVKDDSAAIARESAERRQREIEDQQQAARQRANLAAQEARDAAEKAKSDREQLERKRRAQIACYGRVLDPNERPRATCM